MANLIGVAVTFLYFLKFFYFDIEKSLKVPGDVVLIQNSAEVEIWVFYDL